MVQLLDRYTLPRLDAVNNPDHIRLVAKGVVVDGGDVSGEEEEKGWEEEKGSYLV